MEAGILPINFHNYGTWPELWTAQYMVYEYWPRACPPQVAVDADLV